MLAEDFKKLRMYQGEVPSVNKSSKVRYSSDGIEQALSAGSICDWWRANVSEYPPHVAEGTDMYKEAWLVKHFRNTKNDVIMKKLGLSHSTLHRFARELGLKKTKQFMRKCQRATSEAAKASHLANGTYPPKGYIIPRSEEFRYKPGEKPWSKCGRRRWNRGRKKASETWKHTFLVDRVRRQNGFPQITKLKTGTTPLRKIQDRSYLKKRGYILDEENVVAYWTPETRRATRLEKMPRRFYRFAPLPEKDNTTE